MRKLTATTNKGKKDKILVPESWFETATGKFQNIVKENASEDWVKLFSILSDKDYDDIATSTNEKLETILYDTIAFALDKSFDFQALPLPATLTINSREIPIPKKIGRLSIGQAIQARKSLEGVNDLREGMSILTAIYLQPLIDNTKFDHLRAIEIEQDILLMPITTIYPIGFFLLKRLKLIGSPLSNAWHLMKLVTNNAGKRLRQLLK